MATLVLTTVAASTVPGLMEIAVTSAVVLAAAPVFKKAAPVVNEAFADLVEEATELVVKTAKKTGEIVVKAAEVTAEVVEKTAEITADIVMEITTPNIIRQLKKDNNSNTRANENSTNHKENNGNKQSQQNTKTNTQTQSKQTGTARNAGDNGDDPRRRRNSKTTRNCQDETSDETEPHTGASHLHSRTAVHTVRFAGEIRRAADRSGHQVTELIEDGASTIRDGYIRPPTPDSQLQRAHVLRFRDNFEMLREHYPELYRILCRHAGHTQRIPRVFNVFHRIGGRIDKLQYGWILKLSEVDFSAGPTAANLSMFEAYRQEVLDLYDSEIRLRYYSEQDMAEIRRAKEMMENTTSEELLENALEGFNLEHDYNNPRIRL
uniref:uncharacterized protein LOC120956890 n=1 Tax=Anopheles coluzzii TaxID=1518534 RepID=UPI0020FFAFCC|nr:uncharacterized protein LOC120956890 [Anopheles coluzzii]XP_040234618.2 uncharacterized protein LOC120956890 [Anopheles coluzzii]XP_049465087.1 uncharacterized protein LOC120956890 [Anopheles coluzzii]